MPNSWCNVAQIRREQIEQGIDITFNKVFKPYFIEIISKLSPNNILEIGSGTGHLSKELDSLGFDITAIEPSEKMYAISKEVLATSNVKLELCSSFSFESDISYSLALSHLVAHTVPDLSAFYNSAIKHLTKNGMFIFSIPHPCFYNEYKKIFHNEYKYMNCIHKKISFYITNDTINEITDVPYYHRPLSMYINKLIQSGFTIEYFEEIYPNTNIQNLYKSEWNAPRYCLFICKKVNS